MGLLRFNEPVRYMIVNPMFMTQGREVNAFT